MEKENKVEEQVEQNILDILLDEDNEDPITLYDKDDNAVKFDQVAIIPIEEKLYAILKPIDKLEGVADDEAIVFYIDETNEDDVSLVVEENEDIAVKVFDEYYKLLDEQK